MKDDDLAPVWKALADPTRRTILDLLKDHPKTTGEVCAAFDLSRFAVMKHLSVLEEAGLVLVRRQGRERWNHLNAVPLQQIYERWLRPYEAHWATSLLRLKRHVERAEGDELSMAEQRVLNTFHIEQAVTIEAPRERVFEALTEQTRAWWGKPYLRSETSRGIVLEARLGGRFYEDWGGNDGLLLATVTGLKRPERLQLTGPIGMPGAVQAYVAFELEAQGQATVLRLSHQAIGEVSPDHETSYREGWQDLLGARLKSFVETGQPVT